MLTRKATCIWQEHINVCFVREQIPTPDRVLVLLEPRRQDVSRLACNPPYLSHTREILPMTWPLYIQIPLHNKSWIYLTWMKEIWHEVGAAHAEARLFKTTCMSLRHSNAHGLATKCRYTDTQSGISYTAPQQSMQDNTVALLDMENSRRKGRFSHRHTHSLHLLFYVWMLFLEATIDPRGRNERVGYGCRPGEDQVIARYSVLRNRYRPSGGK